MRTDVSKLKARLRAANAASPKVRHAAAGVMVQFLTDALIVNSHKDTHRYVNAWIEAGVGAGAKAGTLPLKQSAYRTRLFKVLFEQSNRLRARLRVLEIEKQAWYTNKPKRKKDRAYMRLESRIEAQKAKIAVAEKHIAEFAKNDNAIVVTRRSGASLNGYEKNLSDSAVNAQVKVPVYGGVGRRIDTAGVSLIVLRNREPHANPLERRFGTLRRSQAALKSFGAKVAKEPYLRQIASASGLRGKVGV